MHQNHKINQKLRELLQQALMQDVPQIHLEFMQYITKWNSTCLQLQKPPSRPISDKYATLVWPITVVPPWVNQCHFEKHRSVRQHILPFFKIWAAGHRTVISTQKAQKTINSEGGKAGFHRAFHTQVHRHHKKFDLSRESLTALQINLDDMDRWQVTPLDRGEFSPGLFYHIPILLLLEYDLTLMYVCAWDTHRKPTSLQSGKLGIISPH